MSSSPPSDAHYNPLTHSPITSQHPSPQSSVQGAPVTRTVAIIKNHALQHRFDIEPHILGASFEIVKERQMEFDTETDPDTLYELFGDDTDSLAEGPVWVYVLERRRAVEVWNTLMGHPDPEVARKEAPNSLRALYGTSLLQNAVMGSPDAHIAEVQIQSLFASSPPFPSTDLPDENLGLSISSSTLSALRRGTSDEDYAASNVTGRSTVTGSVTSANGTKSFRARPIPATTIKPDIVPRMSRAAALRTGLVVEKTSNAPRTPISKERQAQTFANVPGHKRTSTIAVASTAAPVIAPRMTRAASLRLGQQPAAPPIRRRAFTNEESAKATFDGVPGHKRRESIAVSSSKPPTVAPRLNKSAALRASKDNAPPTSFMFKTATAVKLPGRSQDSSQSPSRPASQASVQAPDPSRSRYAVPRSSSVASMRPPQQSLTISLKPSLDTTQQTSPTTTPVPESSPTKAKPRPSSVAAPNIAPRTNRSAMLRAAKMEAENVAAAAAARKNVRKPQAPSSFKAITT